MTIPRRRQICLEVTPYYHCITRCVRRSFLCGYDKLTRQNFDHRRSWIEERVLLLSDIFCIDVAGYAILSNHYHVILRIDKVKADKLSDEEVISRWLRIYRGSELARRLNKGEKLSEPELMLLKSSVAGWRDSLSNISRFMGNVNEYIARKANKEDDCTGVFWQSRFKSQAILDLPALVQTLSYVDLNPIRARMAKTPESSKYTSIRRRLHSRNSGLIQFRQKTNACVNSPLQQEHDIPISFKEYLELLDWTGRQLKNEKRGSIELTLPSIASRLGYSSAQWIKTQAPQVNWRQRALGSVEKIKDYCNGIGQQWIWQVS